MKRPRHQVLRNVTPARTSANNNYLSYTIFKKFNDSKQKTLSLQKIKNEEMSNFSSVLAPLQEYDDYNGNPLDKNNSLRRYSIMSLFTDKNNNEDALMKKQQKDDLSRTQNYIFKNEALQSIGRQPPPTHQIEEASETIGFARNIKNYGLLTKFLENNHIQNRQQDSQHSNIMVKKQTYIIGRLWRKRVFTNQIKELKKQKEQEDSKEYVTCPAIFEKEKKRKIQLSPINMTVKKIKIDNRKALNSTINFTRKRKSVVNQCEQT